MCVFPPRINLNSSDDDLIAPAASGGPTVTVATPTSVVLKPSPRHRTLSSYVVSSVSEEPDDDGDGETPQPLAGVPALIPSLPPKAVGTDVLSSLLQAATAAVEDASLVAGEQARFHAQVRQELTVAFGCVCFFRLLTCLPEPLPYVKCCARTGG